MVGELMNVDDRLIPIVVGVTGHRDIPLEDYALLEQSVGEQLKRIEVATPNSPHLLISCLAEGADRLVAKVALDRGWKLASILPASIAHYERDFAGDESKREYRDYLAKAEWIEELSAQPSEEPDYLAAGIRVMQQSQLLIALWDGIENGLVGGTGDVVRIFRTEIPDSGKGIAGNVPPDARPVFHILSRRLKAMDGIPLADIGKCIWLNPLVDLTQKTVNGQHEERRWWRIIEQIDSFNRDAIELAETDSSRISQSLGWFDSGLATARCVANKPALSSGNLFVIADAMAIAAQSARQKNFVMVTTMAVLAIVFEQLFSGLIPHPVMLWLAIACGIVALGVLYRAHRLRHEERYLDYRALAEACRVQYFWLLGGVRASVADNFLLDQRDELEWIRLAIRTRELGVDVGRIETTDNIEILQAIQKNWLSDQTKYFLKSSLKQASLASLWGRRAAATFMAGIVSLLLLAIFHSSLLDYFSSNGDVIVNSITVGYGLLFALAGVMKMYAEVMSFREHARGYERGGLLMGRAIQRLERAKDQESIGRVLYEAGVEALSENGDWLLLHRDRPMQVPLQ